MIRFVWIVILLTGCAAREYSSTDRKYSNKPPITCDLKKYNRQIRRFCCQGEKCWFTN